MKELPACGALVILADIVRKSRAHVVEGPLPFVNQEGSEPVKLVVVDQMDIEPTGLLEVGPLVVEDCLLKLPRLQAEQLQLVDEGTPLVLQQRVLHVDLVDLNERGEVVEGELVTDA